MSEPLDSKSWLRSRIHITGVLLTGITTQVRSPSQVIAHEECTQRLDALTFNTNTGLLDIENIYGNNIDTMELEDFKTYVHTIELKTLAAYNDICMGEANNIRPTTPRPG